MWHYHVSCQLALLATWTVHLLLNRTTMPWPWHLPYCHVRELVALTHHQMSWSSSGLTVFPNFGFPRILRSLPSRIPPNTTILDFPNPISFVDLPCTRTIQSYFILVFWSVSTIFLRPNLCHSSTSTWTIIYDRVGQSLSEFPILSSAWSVQPLYSDLICFLWHDLNHPFYLISTIKFVDLNKSHWPPSSLQYFSKLTTYHWTNLDHLLCLFWAIWSIRLYFLWPSYNACY